MSEVADTQNPQTRDEQGPPAGTQEHQIPKHRFDEVSAELRQTREQLQLMKEVMNRQAPQQAQQPQSEQIDYSKYGLDPQTGEVLSNLAKDIVRSQVAPEIQKLRYQNAGLASQNEELAFLMKYGHDKESLIPAIRAKRREYGQQYGSYLPVEDAYRLVTSADPRRSRGPQQHETHQQPAHNLPTPPPSQHSGHAEEHQGGYPNADMTRMHTRSSVPGPAGGSKQFTEMTAEEMEAHLDGLIPEGGF